MKIAMMILMGAFLFGCGKPAPTGWEYQIQDITLERKISTDGTLLERRDFEWARNMEGSSGWELVCALPFQSAPSERGLTYRLIFKRPGAQSKAMLDADLEAIRARSESAVRAEVEAQSAAFHRKLEANKNADR